MKMLNKESLRNEFVNFGTHNDYEIIKTSSLAMYMRGILTRDYETPFVVGGREFNCYLVNDTPRLSKQEYLKFSLTIETMEYALVKEADIEPLPLFVPDDAYDAYAVKPIKMIDFNKIKWI